MTQQELNGLQVRACSIECINHPEWGSWGVMEDQGDWFVIHGRAGSRVLDKMEALKFWQLRGGTQ